MAFTSHIFRLSGSLTQVAFPVVLLTCALLVHTRWAERDSGHRMAGVPAETEPGYRWLGAGTGSPPFSIITGLAAAGTDEGGASFLKDFRFAGTFFVTGTGEIPDEVRLAVISYLPESRQEIVSEGAEIGDTRVVSIHEDRLVLAKGDTEGTLWLGGHVSGTHDSFFGPGSAEESVRMLFGEQTGDGVWTMERAALMDYYDELMDHPERLLQVFDSMRPVYNEQGTIEGYELQAVGEQVFFEAVGLREGDFVRQVNTVPMTNRRRAEFFIRQVVEGRLSAIVIDLERDGGTQRLVYQLR